MLVRYPIEDQEDHFSQFTSSTQADFNTPQFELDCEFSVPDKELAVLLFCVYNENGDNLISWNSFPLQLVREGYRVVPLRDEYNNEIGASFLVAHVRFC